MKSLADIDLLIKQGNTAKAVTAAQAFARRNSRDPAALDTLARALAADGRDRHAITAYDRLIRLRPRSAKPLADKALLLQHAGRLQEAETALRHALALEPLNGSLLRMLTATARPSLDDPLVAPFLSAWTEDTLRPADHVQAGFALGSLHGPEGFHFYREANQRQRQAHPWRMAERQREIAALKDVFRVRPWPKAPDPGRSEMPIFVTGMPRSGTTLVEQILSAHPKVAATGETGLPLRAAYSVLQRGGAFATVSSLQGDDLAVIAQRYLDGIAHFYKPGQTFTDKSIQTNLIIGLMQHVIPKAKTIVVRRDPRDIGWSIYRNYFETGTHGYSNDLQDIAAYWATVEEMVAFWSDLCPESFATVTYEDLVRDPEPQIRRLLEYCELEWDPACLTPERNARAVKTLSVAQVRSAISPKSVGGWKTVAPELQPLINALGDRVSEWD